MGLFSRLGNLWRGFLSLWISDIEKEHPEIAYENAINSMMAKMESAQARLKIQEQLDGLSVDDEVRALDTVRTHIKNTIAEANLSKELSDSSLDARLNALRNQTGDVQAKQELAALKARKTAQTGAQQKTM